MMLYLQVLKQHRVTDLYYYSAHFSMKTVFAFSLFTVGVASALLLSPVTNPILSKVTGTVDTALTTLMGTGNPGCTPYPNCTKFVLSGTETLIELLHSLDTTVDSEPTSTPLGNIKITFPPSFDVILTKDICSKRINRTTRKDSVEFKGDNIQNEIFTDLATIITQLSDIGSTLQNILSNVPCLQSLPQTSGLFSTDVSIAKCLANLPQNANLTGYFRFVVSNFIAGAVYTAH
uniref:Uncharacterized protein n=1 Tax=Strigamia maritima TaxID=126957 RepID=T1ITF0_STRMM